MFRTLICCVLVLFSLSASSAAYEVRQYDHVVMCERFVLKSLLNDTAKGGSAFDDAIINIERIARAGRYSEEVVTLDLLGGKHTCSIGSFVPDPSTVELEVMRVENKDYLLILGKPIQADKSTSVPDTSYKMVMPIGVLVDLGRRKLLLLDTY